LFPTNDNSQLPAASPSIRKYLTNLASLQDPSFCGSLDFLDTQSLFDTVFPPLARRPIFVVKPALAPPITLLDTDAQVSDAIQACTSECRMLVFKAVIRLDYIGHHDPASANHLQVTVKRLRNLSLKFNIRGVTVHGNPDMLFDKYLALTPLLPAAHLNIGGINLFTQFWHALGEPLTRRIALLPRYLDVSTSMFDLTTVVTKDRQMSAIPRCRELVYPSRG
jgi:hypothetical protein